MSAGEKPVLRVLLVLGCLVLTSQTCLAALIELIALGSEWSYLDDGSDQAALWLSPGYDDSGWLTGPAQLGYGDGDEVTLVRCRVGQPQGEPCSAGGAADRIITTYFRRAFMVDDPEDFSSLSLSLRLDDGAVIHLNGQEILRVNMNAGAVFHDTVAASAVEDTFSQHPLATDELVAGINILAVELHQHAPSTSDASFDLKLEATASGLIEITRGPYLQLGTPTSGQLLLSTNVATFLQVKIGVAPDALDQSFNSAILPTTEQMFPLSGLSPGTRYYYSIRVLGGNVLLSGDAERYFETPPRPGVWQPTRVWVIGDSGLPGANAAAVRDAYRSFAATRPADLWLILGDNAYPDGTDNQYQEGFFEPYPLILRHTWVWPTLGNHDSHSADSATQSGPYYDIFSLPTAAEAGGLASGTEAYYSFDYANIHFISLDSIGSDPSPGGAMMLWLEADLAATAQEWIIAFWHHPPYTKGSHNSDLIADSGGRLFAMRENALPILEVAGVDLVLAGHSHSYERSYLLHGHYDTSDTLTAAMVVDGGDGREDGDGVYFKADSKGAVYAVAGSSSRLGGGALDHPAMLIGLGELGSMVLDIHGDRLDAVFLNDAGQELDQFTLTKDLGRIFTDGFESGDTSVWDFSR